MPTTGLPAPQSLPAPLPLVRRGPTLLDRPLPPYAYIPGRAPHPIVHEAGHSHGCEPACFQPLDAASWSKNDGYLQGFDLFHAGYFWEAHETWEGVWRETTDPALRALLQALIQLAAAIVKMREGRFEGVPAFVGRIRAKMAVIHEVAGGAGSGPGHVAGIAPASIERSLARIEAAARDRDLDSLMADLEPMVLS